VDNVGVANAEHAHGLRDDGDQVRGVYAHHLGACAGRVGKRAEDVEDGANTKRTAHRHDGLDGRVQRGRVEERETVGADRSGRVGRRERNRDAQRFQDIG
jgi:hypothetical protein